MVPIMSTRGTIRLAALIAAVVVVQGCAVTTGRYAPDRAPVASHSMVSRYNARYQSTQSYGVAAGSALHVPRRQSYSRYFFDY